VKIYQADNERIMRDHKYLLHILSMLERKVNQDSDTKPTTNAGKEANSKSYDRREDPIGSI